MKRAIIYYVNYKLALLSYASKILGIKLSNYDEIENLLWSKQQDNGGITSLSDQNGNPIGLANCETTSLALLLYNEQLMSELLDKAQTNYFDSGLLLLATSLAIILTLFLLVMLKKKILIGKLTVFRRFQIKFSSQL